MLGHILVSAALAGPSTDRHGLPMDYWTEAFRDQSNTHPLQGIYVGRRTRLSEASTGPDHGEISESVRPVKVAIRCVEEKKRCFLYSIDESLPPAISLSFFMTKSTSALVGERDRGAGPQHLLAITASCEPSCSSLTFSYVVPKPQAEWEFREKRKKLGYTPKRDPALALFRIGGTMEHHFSWALTKLE